MEKTPSEEKSPLLMSIDANEEFCRHAKGPYYEKSRFHGIASGATAVFTEFPNYVSPCWVTAVISSLIIFMMTILLISSLSTSGHQRIPRCIQKEDMQLFNNTIHLVHTARNWPQSELRVLEEILQNYPEHRVHLLIVKSGENDRNEKWSEIPMPNLQNDENAIQEEIAVLNAIDKETTTTRAIVKRNSSEVHKKKPEDGRVSINMGIRRFLDILLRSKVGAQANSTAVPLSQTKGMSTTTTHKPSPKTLQDILTLYPQIILEDTTYSESFAMSPLFAYWQDLNENLRIFALRVLQLWQYGGISFSLFEDSLNLANRRNLTIVDNVKGRSKLEDFIITEKYNIGRLPPGIVVSDDEGLRMVSKSPCHAFFGDILSNLRKTQKYKNAKDVIEESVAIFCNYGAVDKKYCEYLKMRRG